MDHPRARSVGVTDSRCVTGHRAANADDYIEQIKREAAGNARFASIVCIYHLPQRYREGIWTAVGRRRPAMIPPP